MSRILVTGGCGYIGSHTIVALLEQGHEVLCLDSLINASDGVLIGVKLISGQEIINHKVDLVDRLDLFDFFRKQDSIDGVVHFAALKAVGESVEHPLRYFHNNVTGMINLLDACTRFGVKNFVFSSSCTVYGSPDFLPVDEEAPFKPAESPYGRTKQIGEALLQDVCKWTDLRGVSLRYFNPAGAHSSGFIGESPINPPLNLVPIITEFAIGKRNEVSVFGDDYDTRDGSCVRDYIHVDDLAVAHTKAIELLAQNDEIDFQAFNLGTGQGTTVLEAIHAFEKVTGRKLNYKIAPRRQGDIPAIYAANQKAKSILGWSPKLNINDIMRTAWDWEQKRQKDH